MKIAIFSKLTLKEDEIRKKLSNFDVDVFPPIKRGDLMSEKIMKYDVIGIIDGCFLQSTAVAHREILNVIKNKIKVFGAGSMGALRASELDTYGMTGVGSVYNSYKNGVISDDDEVAVTFDDNLNQITFSMISFREMIDNALKEKIIDENDSKQLISSGKELYYPLRTFENVIEKSKIALEKREVLEKFLKNQPDIKRSDAFEMLEEIIKYIEKQ
ncbi:TfuA-related McrA-glycine thioamidation protein [Methanococcus sp. CF]